ncbi:MAG: hypothetical protein ACI8QZ_002252 [Chlamydiales bacterium]
MSSGTRKAALAVLLALGSLVVSCGYSTQLRVATKDGEARTIGVEIFGNDTLERDLERELHEELTRAVRNLVDGDLVSPDRAEVVLRGKLTQFARRGGIRSPDNELLQTGVLIAVEASLIERVTSVDLTGTLPITVDVGFTLTGSGMEASARNRAVQNLANRIALDLFTAASVRKPTDKASDSTATKGVNH